MIYLLTFLICAGVVAGAALLAIGVHAGCKAIEKREHPKADRALCRRLEKALDLPPWPFGWEMDESGVIKDEPWRLGQPIVTKPRVKNSYQPKVWVDQRGEVPDGVGPGGAYTSKQISEDMEILSGRGVRRRVTAAFQVPHYLMMASEPHAREGVNTMLRDIQKQGFTIDEVRHEMGQSMMIAHKDEIVKDHELERKARGLHGTQQEANELMRKMAAG